MPATNRRIETAPTPQHVVMVEGSTSTGTLFLWAGLEFFSDLLRWVVSAGVGTDVSFATQRSGFVVSTN
jgi:hypothetical protein